MRHQNLKKNQILSDKPRFDPSKSNSTYTVIEGETLNISLNASGNPPQIKYKWRLPQMASKTRVSTEGSDLLLMNAQRSERGNYSILAWNGHGNFNTSFHVYIDVLYPPK